MSNSFILIQASRDKWQRIQGLLTCQAGIPLASGKMEAQPAPQQPLT